MADNPALAGAGRAALFAGPCFVLSLSAAMLYAQIPDPIVITPGQFLGVIFLLVPATVVGAILAFLPSLAGSMVMGWLARHLPALRLVPIWALAGGVLAGIPFFFAAGEPGFAFAFIVTGAVCATICRRQWYWNGASTD